MHVTVAICTWNRSRLLDQTLTEMHKLAVPADVTWELLVVNNNCTDDTDAVIARHELHLPLRRLFEPRQGHSHARNRAVAEARGELIVWTDDDVLVDPNWITEYVKASRQFPDAAFFGGRIRPWFEIDPPAWVLDNLPALEGYLAIRDLGDRERPFAPNEAPFGANMAFRAPVQRQFSYDGRLGNVKRLNLAGEETDVVDRMRAVGYAGIWVPSARVDHFITRERLGVKYFRCYCHDRGVRTVRMSKAWAGPRLFGAPRWLWRELVANWIYYLRARTTTSTGWVVPLMRLMFTRGKLAGYHASGKGSA